MKNFLKTFIREYGLSIAIFAAFYFGQRLLRKGHKTTGKAVKKAAETVSKSKGKK